MDLIRQAQLYLSRGISIVPVKLYFDDKGKCKKPATVRWTEYQKAPVKQSILLTQWKKLLPDEPGIGVALITGAISNLIVVDIDTESSLEELKPFLKGVLTPVVKTPGGGWHIYFQYREGLNTTAGLDHDGLDIRAEGGYVVAPPGRYPATDAHPHGIPYEFLKSRSFPDIPITQMPDVLHEHLINLRRDRGPTTPKPNTHGGKREGSGRPSKESWFQKLLENGVEEGQRTTRMVEMIGYLLGRKVPKPIIRSIIRVFNKTLKDPLTPAELKQEVLPAIHRIARDTERAIVDKLNESLSLVTLESGERVVGEFYKNYSQRKRVRFAKISHVRASYVNKTMLINKKPESMFDVWFTHEDRKEHQGVIFNPSLPPWETEKYINLWGGIKLKPKEGKWDKFRWHIEHVISEEHSEWILQWMARIVQDPGGPRPGTVIVMRGGQGTGKGTFANIFGSVLGEREYFYRVSKIGDLTGKFNNDLNTAILLHIDEATWGGDKETAGVLKSLVTEPTRRIEPKGINAFHVENYLNLIISSNNQWIVPAGAQERRFMVLDIPDIKQSNHEYFGEIYQQMYKEGGLEAMYYDLLRYPYDIKTISRIPRTPATTDQILRSLTITQEFLFERLYLGTWVDSHDYWKTAIAKDKLYSQYTYFCDSKGVRRGREGRALFYRTISKILNWGQKQCRRPNGTRYRVKTVDNLEKTRKSFQDFFGVTIKWPELDEPDGITPLQREQDDEGPFHRGEEPPPF